MRSVLVVFAAIAATVVIGAPAAAQNARRLPSADLVSRVRLDPSQVPDRGTMVYIVQMSADPAISYTGGIAGFAKTAPAPGQRYNARTSTSEMYAAHLATQQDKLLASIGATDRKIYSYRHAFNGFAARLTAAEAFKLRKDKGVVNVWEDRKFKLETNSSPKFLGLTNESNGLWAKHGLTGENVIIGVVDTGIVQEHPSLDDAGYAPPSNWNGACEAGDGFAADDCNNKLIGARFFKEGFEGSGSIIIPTDFISPRDSDGHGTHTATTAGGNGGVQASLGGTPLAKISGMAPRARIAVYKGCWQGTGGPNDAGCTNSDTTAAVDAAVADGVDIITYSIGTSASIIDSTDLAFLFAADAGIFVSRSAGNEGPAPATTAAGEPWAIAVAASTHKGTSFALATRINSPAAVAGSYASLESAISKSLEETGPITNDLVAANPGDACLPIGAIGGKIALIARGGCDFSVKLENAANAGAQAVLMYTNANPKTVMGGDANPGSLSIPAVMIDNAPGVAILAQLTGGQAVNATLSAGIFIKEQLVGNIMAEFSSRGPSPVADFIKPDITAPGVQVLAGGTPEPNDGSFGGYFQYLSGTSMATPHIAGIAALLIEAHPDWTPAMVKSALMTSSRQNVVKEDGVTKANAFDFGAGHVDPNKARDPGLVYDAGFFDYLAALCDAAPDVFSDPAATCAFLGNSGFSLDASDLNLPSIGIGELLGTQTIVRRVTNVALSTATYKSKVKAPPGFKVKVNPSTLTLRRGETKSFEVTFTNVSATGGAWSFGALTWEDGKHKVRSPIALRARAVVAPAEISGTGISGSTSFDATFGYNGAYSAGAHGLVDPFVTWFPITDDPANSFDFDTSPTATDEVITYLFELPAGTPYAQWQLFDKYNNGTHDMDMYLFYCPNFFCTQIDQSFTVTSNERVSTQFALNDPAIFDPYLVFIHGYDTAGGLPAEGIMFDWTVLDAEGNMTTSGPTTVSIGQTSAIEVDWSGLFAGSAGLQAGAVSHSDASGIQALTVVNIANDGDAGFEELCADLPGLCPPPPAP